MNAVGASNLDTKINHLISDQKCCVCFLCMPHDRLGNILNENNRKYINRFGDTPPDNSKRKHRQQQIHACATTAIDWSYAGNPSYGAVSHESP